MRWGGTTPGMPAAPVRAPSVAGAFYPERPADLRRLVEGLFDAARLPGAGAGAAGGRGLPLAILVPHAGLVYSGVPAAAGWGCLWRADGEPGEPGERGEPGACGEPGERPPTVVLLGTNHRAGWLDGVGAWEAGAWVTPAGEHVVDSALAALVVALGPPFLVDREAHLGEHSLEVQLPLLSAVAPGARIVPLAVSAGVGSTAIEAGARLGRLLGERRAAGERLVLAISTDMAHYPPAAACARATETLLPAILDRDPEGLAALERGLRDAGIRGLACGMCGIEPAVLGIAAVRAMGAASGTTLAKATSADAGGPPDRTVGYLAVRFDG
jgi:AmmeMemoRadiSam system protein B